VLQFWRDEAARVGKVRACRETLRRFGEFVRDSTPSRLRQRYGDVDYDWDYRVNTTGAAVGWRDRLLGVFHSPYQPTEPALFHEMMEGLKHLANLDLSEFTFLDLGCGKGRTLLMASDYPFRRIVGVELLPNLAYVAEENLRVYKSESQKCFSIECVCADAVKFPLPGTPLILYLFNPFPETGLRQFLGHLERSIIENPRPVCLLYHNPVLEKVLAGSKILRRIGGTHQYSVLVAGLAEGN
jgi:SAM-dependent methyltransferase